MRLSVVFELLLVFLFLAFAAARVIDPAKGIRNVAKGNKKTTTLRQGPPNRYCACTSRMCNCCRDFSLPVVPIKGPGCASIMYVQKDTMMVTMSFGDRVLSNTTITGKTPKPICMALPGGISQFCGRVYGISRKGDQFRACLGLELRALDDIEAALRVSCFKFGPKGVKLESAPPVPAESGGKDPDEEEEDDYDLDDDEDDDLIGFGVDDEDDGASSEDNEVDSDSVDYTGFSVLGEDILGTLFSDDSGSSNAKKKKPSKKTAKPQVLLPKTSTTTTTKRPILPTRRRSTAKPLTSVTKRPLVNRITKRPALIQKPQIIQRPAVPVVVSPQATAQSTFLLPSPTVVTKADFDKKVVTKTTPTTTEVPITPMKIITTMQSQEKEKLSQETTIVTEEPITFIIPTQKTEILKNDIKLPQTDLAKLEAVAAIAQQDVTSGVISSSSMTTEEAEKPVTIKYDKLTSYLVETTPYFSPQTEKISSIKFEPSTIVTPKPVVNVANEGVLLDEMVDSNAPTVLEPEIVSIKNNINSHQQTMISALNEENKVILENDMKDKEIIGSDSATKKGNYTVSLKKQPEKKHEKVKDKEEDEEEEEEEGEEEDLLEGVLSDDDDSNNEDIDDNESNNSSQSTNATKNDDDEDEEEEDDEDDILSEAVETSQKVKPSKVSIKKKPASDATNKDEEEEEEEEEDILDVLRDDDEEEESEDDDEDDDDDDDEEDEEPQKHKKKPTTQTTTVKVRNPTTQQTVITRKPTAEAEKVQLATTHGEKITEKVTEKVFIYKEPTDKVPENTAIMYHEPENEIPEKIFIYKEPENQIIKKTTEKVIFYKEPSEQIFTEKFVIYKEPEEKFTESPTITVQDDKKSSEDIKDTSDEEEKAESDDEGSSEEDSEGGSEKHTLMASILKPEFSNKYMEEHDLTEDDDLEIEDSEDEGIDSNEDRQLKNRKKAVPKSPTKKSEIPVTKPKLLTLSDLIGQRKNFVDHSKNDKLISTSRTHRRMNLDRLL